MTPTLDQIAEALRNCAGKYVEFKYTTQFPPSRSPSAVLERERTIFKRPLNQVKAFIGGGVDEKTTPWLTKAGNWCITLYTMWRQDIDTREYKPRCYRLEGVRLESIVVCNGSRGKEPLFPQVVQDLELSPAEREAGVRVTFDA